MLDNRKKNKGERMPHSSKWSPQKMNTGIDAPTKLFSPNLFRLFSTLRFFNPFLPIRTTFFSFFFRGCGLILGSSSAAAISTSSSSSWGTEAGEASDSVGCAVDGGSRGTRVTWSVRELVYVNTQDRTRRKRG